MSDSKNPFVVKKQGRYASRGAIIAWFIALISVVAALALVWIWTQDKTNHQQELQDLHASLFTTKDSLSKATTASQADHKLIASLKNQVADLEKEKETAVRAARSLEDEMRETLESKDVTISKLQGKLTVTIVDRVMFDSGEAILKPDGAAVMQKVAELLTGHPELNIHVIGHTDNIPIRQTAQSRFASNWELSTARSLAAVHFLIDKGGVDPRRIGAVGYGEFRPIADNSTAEGRAKNRRIAITILPDELAISDAMPNVAAEASTNAITLTAQELQEP
jgi:chemotaxis protein MotB